MGNWFKSSNWPLLAVVATIGVGVVALRWQGQPWLCQCGHLRLWISEAYSYHTSQHLTDPYSFTHFQHGLVFCAVVGWCAGGWTWPWRRWLAIAMETAWEIFENTEFVINRYRDATAALGYLGDSIVNSLGDIAACWAGLEVARRVGWRWSLVIFFAIEVVLLATIRDSLLMNIVMLLFPTEALKAWQIG